MKQLHSIGFVLLLLAVASCNVTRQVPDNDALYTGASIRLKPVTDSIKFNRKDLEEELGTLVRPAPNTSFLGIRFKLFFYNLAGNPAQKGLRSWIKRKLGEPPVLASSVNFEKNRQVLQNRMENRGYFHSEVTVDTVVKHKKAEAVYVITVFPRYLIQQVQFPNDSSDISQQLNKFKRRSLLRPGRPYDLDQITNEYTRMDSRLKENGFYYFNPGYLIVDVDSAIGNHRLNMTLKLKKETPADAKKVFRINEVLVFADYNLRNDTSAAAAKAKATLWDNYYIYDRRNKFNPKIFSRTLVFKPGDVYNREAHNRSLSRLVSLGVYKFVKARFERVDTAEASLLNAFYYLTPAPKKSIRMEVSGLTKSNNANGGEVSLSWRNRNFFKGAELFSASIYGGLERQIAAQQRSVSINRLGVDLNLFVPRIIGPVNFQTNSGFVPQTKFNLGYELYNRTDQYTLSSFRGSFGYVWKESLTKEHQLNIVSINYVKPANIDSGFQKGLDTNITLARSLERQFIIGSNYNFNINTQASPNRKRHNFYFNANIDLSGNLLGLATGANVREGKEKKIFSTPFSQYTRLELDFRHYLRIGRKKTVLASRLLTGAGWAYGNSTTMPFIKEFFAGGVNDLRAFRARSLGPGKYYGGNSAITGFLPDQPGDIKMLLSTELRAKLFSVIYGAVFVDAGNTWLTREDPTRPGGKFGNDFITQMAVGTGVGLRVDISFFVLRLDAAVPVHKPYNPAGQRWAFDLGNKNIVYNLAIGYPF